MKKILALVLVLICGQVNAQWNGCVTGFCNLNNTPVVPLTPYLGQVATRTYLPDAVNTTNRQLRSRSIHLAQDTITNPTIVFPNFYVDGFGSGATYQELGPGGSNTITAAIEYPLGANGSAISCPSGGVIANVSTITCTWTGTITKGDYFAVRTFITSGSGVVFSLGLGGVSNVPGNFQFGDILDAAVSGLTDNTTNGGAYTATSGTSRYSPIIIAAQTNLPSVLVIGDSKSYGENDIGDGVGNIGETQRWVSLFFANANWGIRGRDAGQFVANCTIQCSFGSYFTHLINEDGVNGFIHGQNAATVATNTDALGNKFPSLIKYNTTILPVATTTDNYVTLANQTTAAYNSGRVTENDRRRSIPAPWFGVFDSADALESSRNSGLVAVQSGGTGSLNYFTTSSSVHPVNGGYERVADFNRSTVAAISRNGVPLSFSNRVTINETDHAEDETDASTYTFSNKNFLIGTPSANRLVIIGCTSRLGTTSASANSLTIGGVVATKIVDVLNTTGGALTIQSVWVASGVSGNTATISTTYSTTMLRAGCDVWTATGSNSLPTISANATNAGASNVSTTSAITLPALGGGIIFSSVVNGSLPTVVSTNQVTVTQPIIVGSGTLFYMSGSMNQQGSKSFSSTWSVGTVATSIAIAISP